MSRYGLLVLGLLAGLALGFNLGRVYGIRAARAYPPVARGSAEGPRVVVLAAARLIPAGTVLASESLATKLVDAVTAQSAVHAEDRERVVGRKTLFSLEAGEELPWSYVDSRPAGP